MMQPVMFRVSCSCNRDDDSLVALIELLFADLPVRLVGVLPGSRCFLSTPDFHHARMKGHDGSYW